MMKLFWIAVLAIYLNLFTFTLVYISAHSQNSSYFKSSKTVEIKYFSRLCWFKDKQKGAVEYCYIMQVYSVLQFFALLAILAVCFLCMFLSNKLINHRIALAFSIFYTFINGGIMTFWSMGVEAKNQIAKKKANKKKKELRLKRQQKKEEKLETKSLIKKPCR